MNFSNQVIANQVVDRCGSTNDLARQLGESGFSHGTWISARVQDQGRGRLGREWTSVNGNLFLSVVVRPEPKALWTWIPMAAAVGVAEAIQGLFSSLPVRVKWPNDLWLERKKLGGILCEAFGGREDSFVVIGIGLNCAGSPQTLDQPTTSLSEQLGLPVNADDVRAAIVNRVVHWMNLDTARISAKYETMAALSHGTAIQWADGAETGSVVGLGPMGELYVHDSRGKTVSLFAEDVKIRLNDHSLR